MTDEKIIEEMAGLDGWVKKRGHAGIQYWDHVGYGRSEYRPNTPYLTDHNACQRVIDGMSSIYVESYIEAVTDIVKCDYGVPDFTYECVGRLAKATPRQKCEAILKAYDKWEES